MTEPSKLLCPARCFIRCAYACRIGWPGNYIPDKARAMCESITGQASAETEQALSNLVDWVRGEIWVWEGSDELAGELARRLVLAVHQHDVEQSGRKLEGWARSGCSMADNPSEKEPDAEFQRVLSNLANTPHKPHVPPTGVGTPKKEPKR